MFPLPISEIIGNVTALQLDSTTVAQVLTAVLTPLLRTAKTPQAALEPASRPSRRPRSIKRSRRTRRKRKYTRHAPSEARERAIAALRANPDATPTEIAKIAKVSRSTVVHAREALDAEARKAARKAARETSKPAKSTERRQRAQQFLREQLARGAKQASVVEEAAAKAHIDEQALGQARVDLGVVTSRSNAGGVQVVQWSLPG
jgi:hypothetical protein